jgi:multidrug efflux pump subunit AcrB
MLITNIGVLMDWPAAYTPNTGPMDAFMLLQLKEGRRSIFEVVETLRRKLRQQFPQAEFAFDTGGMLTAALNFGEPAPIHFQVKGSDLVVLETLGHEIARLLVGVDGAADVRVAQRNDYPTLEIDIDRTKAALAGLTTEDVMHNLITATNSSINFMPSFWIDPRNGNHYFIGAQYPESEHVSADTLLDIPLTPSGGGATVPLRTVATLERGTGPSFVSHRNITRVVDVYADVAPGANLGQVVSRMEEALFESAELALEPFVDERGNVSFQVGGEYAGRGYTLSASGEIQSMRTSFKQFARGFVLALVLIYLLLVAQLRSFIDPLMILLTVPLGFIGVSLVLFATGTSLNIQSLMGIIMMAGIVVEYGIILVHFANERVEQGQPIVEAVKEAARVRLRPILMTSLTTALALLPMALGIAGAEANMPLARTIIGGVLGAMVLTLFVLPCLYVWMKRPLKPREQDEELDAVTGEPTHV